MYSIVSLYFYYFTGRHPSVLKGCPGKWPVMGQGKAFGDMKPEGEIKHLIKKCM